LQWHNNNNKADKGMAADKEYLYEIGNEDGPGKSAVEWEKGRLGPGHRHSMA
jgi:hypothetical protein